jgi:hypothetical protein
MMRPKVVLEYERAMAEALRVKVEEKMLDNFLGDDEATKEVYRAHGFGRAPLSQDQPNGEKA